jgi:hypothetical protein
MAASTSAAITRVGNAGRLFLFCDVDNLKTVSIKKTTTDRLFF